MLKTTTARHTKKSTYHLFLGDGNGVGDGGCRAGSTFYKLDTSLMPQLPAYRSVHKILLLLKSILSNCYYLVVVHKQNMFFCKLCCISVQPTGHELDEKLVVVVDVIIVVIFAVVAGLVSDAVLVIHISMEYKRIICEC